MSSQRLSKRELQVVRLLTEGRSNKQIAAALGISEGTVEFHLTSIYGKLGVASRVEAILLLRQPGVSLDHAKPADTGETQDERLANQGKDPGDSRGAGVYYGDGHTPSTKYDGVDGRKAPPRMNYPILITFGMALALTAAVVLYLDHSRPKSWNGYERECEYPDKATVGETIGRSNASGKLVHGQFGTMNAEPWSPTAGEVVYENIGTPKVEQAFLRLRYSKNSPPSVPILIYVDDEKTPRASLYPQNQENWNRFAWTDPIFLGSVESGVHTLTFYTVGQQYGVADLDKFVLSAGSP